MKSLSVVVLSAVSLLSQVYCSEINGAEGNENIKSTTLSWSTPNLPYDNHLYHINYCDRMLYDQQQEFDEKYAILKEEHEREVTELKKELEYVRAAWKADLEMRSQERAAHFRDLANVFSDVANNYIVANSVPFYPFKFQDPNNKGERVFEVTSPAGNGNAKKTIFKLVVTTSFPHVPYRGRHRNILRSMGSLQFPDDKDVLMFTPLEPEKIYSFDVVKNHEQLWNDGRKHATCSILLLNIISLMSALHRDNVLLSEKLVDDLTPYLRVGNSGTVYLKLHENLMSFLPIESTDADTTNKIVNRKKRDIQLISKFVDDHVRPKVGNEMLAPFTNALQTLIDCPEADAMSPDVMRLAFCDFFEISKETGKPVLLNKTLSGTDQPNL